jgi:hypothetical protein
MDLESGRPALPGCRADRRSLSRSPASLGSGAQAAPNDLTNQKAWIKAHQKRLLDKGKIEKLGLSLRSTESTNAEVLEKIRTEADYFARNAERMRYPKFRRQHLFVGSGVIEAGCKTVIGSRLKQSGMFWTVRGANAIIALRCCHLNDRFEDYWESRRVAQLPLLCRPPGTRPFSEYLGRHVVAARFRSVKSLRAPKVSRVWQGNWVYKWKFRHIAQNVVARNPTSLTNTVLIQKRCICSALVINS